MKRSRKLWFGLLAVALIVLPVTEVSAFFSSKAKTIGVFDGPKAAVTEGFLNTLKAGGWKVEILNMKDLETPERLAQFDVIFAGGGHNIYFFPSAMARLALTQFVAQGKGLYLGAVRGGYVRSANRPMFPQVGEVYNRVNSPWIKPYGDSVLSKLFKGQPLTFGSWDHMVVKMGPQGTPFAVGGNTDVIGAFGEPYGGRVILFGVFLMMDPKEDNYKLKQDLLLGQMDWLASAPKRSQSEIDKAVNQATGDFQKREFMITWTQDKRGPDSIGGIIPRMRDNLLPYFEAPQFTLEYYSKFLPPDAKKECLAVAHKLKQRADSIKRTASSVIANAEKTLATMDTARFVTAYATGNPVLNEQNLKAQFTVEANNKDKVIEQANALIKKYKGAVQATKDAALKAELAEDVKNVPALIAQLADAKTAVRLEAATELGRIGDKRAVAALIPLLADKEERVRTQAMISLAWMQATEAVPALLKIMQDKSDMAFRRRAIQALGQIGDSRAVDPIMALLNDKLSDSNTMNQVILSLGWLKAKKAIPELTKILNDEKSAYRFAAIIALAEIGDPSVKPEIQKIVDKNPIRHGKRGIVLQNYLSMGALSDFSLSNASRAALKILELNARKTPGITQNIALSGKDNFYALTRRYNALAGRPETVRNETMSGLGQNLLWPYLVDAGMTGVHNAWGWETWEPDDYREAVKNVSDLGMIFIDVLNGGGAGMNNMPASEIVLDAHADVPGFKGFWTEETWPDMGGSPKDFEAYLIKKYGADYRKKLNLKPDEVVTPAGSADQYFWGPWGEEDASKPVCQAPRSGALRTEALAFSGDLLEAAWKESQDWLHMRRKGCANTYVISTADPHKVIGGNKALKHMDSVGPESYQCFGRNNAYLCEKFRDGEARSAMAEFYNWYSPGREHDLRGFYQTLIHGQCFYNFALHQIFPFTTNYHLWSWDSSRWADLQKVTKTAQKIKDFITVPPSAANVALVGSERSTIAFKRLKYYQISIYIRTEQERLALWTALAQSQIPSDVLYAEGITPEKLEKYNVLILTPAKMLTDGEADILRDWVKKGGTLITTGTATIFDPVNMQLLKNYRMADVFGVNYLGDQTVADPNKHDTFAYRQLSPTSAFKVHTGLGPEQFEHFDDMLHRDIKPTMSLIPFKTTAAAPEFLPGIAANTELEYDLPLGYDKVKPTTATVLASFNNGDPALTVNRFGKGLCYFYTLSSPGMCHISSEWEMQPNKFDFWPNMQELIVATVKGGLASQNADVPVIVSNVSKEVEVTIHKQPDHGNRYVVHILDYDVKSPMVKGAKVFVPASSGKVKRMYYPADNKNIAFKPVENGATADLRDFPIYDVFVIEWAEPAPAPAPAKAPAK